MLMMMGGRRVAAAVVTVLAVAGLTGPAVAAEPVVELTPYLRPVTVAPGSDGTFVPLLGSLPRGAARDIAHRVVYRVDSSAVAEFATVAPDDSDIIVVSGERSEDPGSPCSGSGPVLTCTIVLDPGSQLQVLGYFQVRPAPAARVGDSGEVVVTTRVDGGPVTTTRSRIRIGEGVDLASSGTAELSARPGGTAAYRPTVRNAGTRPVDGVVLYFSAEPDWFDRAAFTNCTYGHAVVCTFDTALAPGTSYGLSQPMTLRAPGDAAAGSVAAGWPQWLTAAAWEDLRTAFTDADLGRPGTRTALSLVPAASAAGPPQADEDEENQRAGFELTVAGARRPDIAAVGARLTGAAGSRVAARVGFENRGPGTLHPALFGNNFFPVTVEVPAGITVEKADSRCTDWCTGADGTSYLCWMRADPVRPGQAVLFTFTFGITAAFDGDEGRVEVDPDLGRDDPLENGRTAANNTAKLSVVRPGGAGGGLPITGTGLGAAAAALLVAGAALVLASRRRRQITG